jgi:thiamine-phosphate pyrophosphorylase
MQSAVRLLTQPDAGTNDLATAGSFFSHNPGWSGVYAITDSQLLSGEQLPEAVHAALRGGIRVLQYRNKTAAFADQVREAATLKALCDAYNVPLLINDDIDLCQAVDASGVHLGQSDTTVADARYRLGATAIIGSTCHNRADLIKSAELAGADYVAVGRFFDSHTKPQAPQTSIDELRQLRAATQLPIVAIGGITADNGGDLIKAGADMLAVIHYLFATSEIESRAKALCQLF